MRSLKEDIRDLRDQSKGLQEALANAPMPPGMQHFRQLESKLAEVEHRHKQRERDLQSLLEKTRTTASNDLIAMRVKYNNIIQKKNMEIDAFRAELDHMLATIAAINGNNAANGVVYVADL